MLPGLSIWCRYESEEFSQHALGRWHALHSRIQFDRLPEGARCRFEDALNDMMGVAAVMTENVQIECAAGCHGPPELFREWCWKSAERLGGNVGLPDQKRSAAKIDCGGHQRFIHRHG